MVTDVFGFVDVLVRLAFGIKCSKVKVTADNDPKMGEYYIFVTIGGNFTTVTLHMYLGLGHTD